MSELDHITTRVELVQAVKQAEYALREARLDLNEYDRIERGKVCNCNFKEVASE